MSLKYNMVCVYKNRLANTFRLERGGGGVTLLFSEYKNGQRILDRDFFKIKGSKTIRCVSPKKGGGGVLGKHDKIYNHNNTTYILYT